ncbi:MAG: HAD family phosphatase [Flavobacteriaceae bacterium]|jgi:2-haloacid dehalogenase|nr:HAD family phosphatase [Flavobacteriaceae bacterium]
MTNIKNIIFDLGGVLIDWNPDYVFKEVFKDDEKLAWFYREICTMDWNENQDAGYPLDKATEELVALFPQYEDWIRQYYGRWEEMLGDANQGTVQLLKQCVDSPELKVLALTNWSAETFPVALKKFDFLQWFEGIVVSGEEMTRKPFPEIYHTTLKRFEIKAEESLFIDDNLRNIEAAAALGIQCIHFISPQQLEKKLKELKLL